MKNEPWYAIFDKTSKTGRGLVNKALFATTIAPIVGGIIVGFAIAYVLVALNMYFTIQNIFITIPPGADVTLVPSSSPSCVGDYTLSVGSTTIDCIGTSPTAVLCDNGYDGVLFKGALLCPTSSAVVPPGSVCAQGGIVLFYQNANETFNVTNCITDQPTVVNCTNGQSGIQFGNVTICNAPTSNTTITGGNFIGVSVVGPAVLRVDFTGQLNYNGSHTTLIDDAASLTLRGLDIGPGITIVLNGNDLVFLSDISFTSVGTGVDLINDSTAASVQLKTIDTSIPQWLFSDDGSGTVVLSSTVMCADGRPSFLYNGVAYCSIMVNSTSNATACNGATQYNMYGNGTLLQTYCAAGSSIDKQFIDTSTVAFNVSGSTVSANAILTLNNAQPNGSSVIASTSGNTGVFKTISSNIPGFSIFDSGTGLSFNSNVTCADGRQSVIFNGSIACNWQLSFGPPVVGVSPAGTIVFSSDVGSTAWNLPGPLPYIPASPSLWPANTTLVEQALNYLGIYRAQNGICPSAGQAMITVNGVPICVTRIDPGPSITGCPGGKYDLDNGLTTATVCQPHVWDGSEVTVNALAANFSVACGGLNDVTSTLNCIWNNYIYPGLVNQTSASTIVYTPPFPVNCQSSFTISAVLTYLIVSQLPNNTFNIYVNPIIGDDTCGGGTFARPYATIDYAVSKIPPAPVSRLFNIILSVNTHTVMGDLYLPPNVQFTTTGNLRFTTINVTGNIYLNATSWALYANAAAFGGFSGIILYYTQMIIDFRILGSYGPSSDVRLQLYNSGLFGNGVYVYGRGSVDLFHVNDIDSNNDIHLNCVSFHQEKATMSNADTIITDTNCTTPVTQSFFHQYHINDYLGSSSLSISQTTSTIHAEIHSNGFDDGALTLLGTVQDALVADVNGLPINLFTNTLVKFEIKANAMGVALDNLNSSYWGNTFLTVDAMFAVVQSYLKMLAFSGSGQSLLDSTTITTNTLKGLRSLSSGLTITPAAGTLDFTVVPSAFITVYNTSDPRCDSAGGWVLVIGGLPSNITGCYGSDTDVPTTITGGPGINVTQTSNSSFIVALNPIVIASGNGINVTQTGTTSFIVGLTPFIFANVGNTNSIIAINNATVLAFKGIGHSTNIQITDDGSNLLIGLVASPSVTSLTTSAGVNVQNAAPVCLANSANTASTCLYASPSLSNSLSIFLPSDNGTAGELVVTDGNGHWYYEPLSAVINATTVTGDAFIQAAYTMATNTYALSFVGTIYSTSSAITVTKNTNGTFGIAFTNPAVTLLSGGANVIITPGIGSNNFTISVSATSIPIVFGGAGASPFITNNATLISFKGLTAGLNMVVTSGGTDNTVATTTTPTFTTIAATANSNQFTIGTTNLLTLNFAALATAYTLTVPDFGGAASVVGTLLAQTIGGVKTFSAQTIFSSTTNQFVLGTTNTVTINSIAPAASRTYTIPDSGANSAFVLTDGAQTINGVKTHSSQIPVTATSNQFVLGTTNTVTINSPAPAASRTYTIPDTGANSAFIMSDLAQTINGIKTFSAQTLFTSTTNQFVLGTTNTVTINSPAPAASRTYTIPDTGANSAFVMTDLAQTINGVKTFSAKPVLSTNVGVQFNNAGNTASVTLATQAGLASSITLNLPTTVGNNGDVLMGDGTGNINFATPSLKTMYSNTATLTQLNPGAGVFVTMYPTGTVSLTIPANLLVAGSKIRFEIFGSISTNAASTFSFRNRLDGTTVYGTSSSSTGVILSTIPFSCHGFLSILTSGASGIAVSSGKFFAFTSTTNAIAGFTSTATVAIDTTMSHTFDTQFAFSASNAANNLVIIGATVQHVKPYA